MSKKRGAKGTASIAQDWSWRFNEQEKKYGKGCQDYGEIASRRYQIGIVDADVDGVCMRT